MGKFDILKMFGDIVGSIFGIFDNAYKEGWLWYMLFGIIIIVVLVFLFN